MHIGVSVSASYLPSQLDAIDRYMEYAGRLGLDSIELDFSIQGHLPEYAPLPNPWEESPEWVEVARRAEAFALPGVHLPYIGLNPLSDDPAVASRATFEYRASIDRAAGLGLRYGVIHAVGHRPGTTRATWLPLWVDYMGQMAEHAAQAGLILCLENASYGFFLEDVIHILQQVDSPWLRMTLDVGHVLLPRSKTGLEGVTYGAYGTMERFIEEEGHRIFTLHIHDNLGQDDDHLVIGDGVGDFGYLRMLYEQGFEGAWTFEHRILEDWDSVEVATRRLRKLVGAELS